MEVEALNDPEEAIRYFRLQNKNGMSVDVINLGAAIVSIKAPDRNGTFADVVLGYKNLRDYKTPDGPYLGSAIGPNGNRTKGAEFWLNGKLYKLAANNGPNHLHGGKKGFDKVLWQVESHTDNSITLSYVARDGEEGYPGNRNVRITYTLDDANELHIKYWAQTDKATPINLTNHSYFNLKGEGNGTIENHIMQVHASRYTPVDTTLIPTGIEPVAGTPLDYTTPHAINDALQATENQQIKIGAGIDHNFVLDSDKGMHKAAHVEEPESGRVLDVLTTEPGVQVYTGNYLDGTVGKSGRKYSNRAGFCLETQHFPDSVNHPEFPTTILEPGQTYESETVFKFSVDKSRGASR